MFRLSVHMVNEAMRTPGDLAQALYRVAKEVAQTGEMEGVIMDNNGNTVGHYRTTHER